MNDGRQQEQDEKIQLEPSFSDYWAKREQDRRDERAFWAAWDRKYNGDRQWPCK